MDANSVPVESNNGADHGWKTVSYQKKNRKQQQQHAIRPSPEIFSGAGESDVFRSIEQHSEDRRRRIMLAQKAAELIQNSGANHDATVDEGRDEEDDGGAATDNGSAVEEKKSKPKKPKKPKEPKEPKVTVAEAAAKIDASDLAAFLADITASYETQKDIQLMRFADYFGRAFAKVNSSQFPWMKILKESSVTKMADVPLSHISEDVYKTSADWLNHQSVEALVPFVLWSLDSILDDLAFHQGARGSKKAVQQAPSKSQVAMFVVLAIVLRRKPDLMINLLSTLEENAKYQGQDKLPLLVWMVTQASQGDLVVGLFTWMHFLLPMLSSKSNSNPQSRDIILQLVERILSSPKARTILVNGAVRKGERVVPPSALELLMRATFPAPSARLKATERFEAIYATLKEVALAVSPGSKAMKQLTQQIMLSAIKAVGDGVSDLSKEASELVIWCLTQNPECYKQWDNIYLENLQASVVILKKLSSELKVYLDNQSNLDLLKATLKSFRLKNERAMTSSDNAACQSSLKNSDKYCKLLLGRVSHNHGCLKSLLLVTVAFAVSAAFLSKDLHSLDLKKLLVDFNLT